MHVGFLLDSKSRHKIPTEPCAPVIAHKTFYSDAAGCPDRNNSNRSGVSSICINESGEICFATQYLWSEDMIVQQCDFDGKPFGQKTTFLETVGLIIPVLLLPESLANQHVVFFTDNTSCMFNWENKSSSDPYSAILVRALHVISCYLSSIFHVEQKPRCSDWAMSMVDRMSRQSTTTHADHMLLHSYKPYRLPSFFLNWLKEPKDDWSLVYTMLDHVKSKYRR